MVAALDVFLPLPLTTRGPGYTCGVITRAMAAPDFDVTIVTPRTRGLSVSPASIMQALPFWARHVPYRWVHSMSKKKIEAAFLSQAMGKKTGHRAAYIWPDASLQTIEKLKAANIKIFREMINCHRGAAKIILDDAYERMGLKPQHAISEESILDEQMKLKLVDYIFCPNGMVENSIRENGLAEGKILSASYGWDPARFGGKEKSLAPIEGLTALFVGTICVRKGCHLLLDYWSRSGVSGRLVLVGDVEPAIKDRCAHLLARDDVIVLDYSSDIAALYRSADVFVFPTLEEGGPQVTYEACGCGLPVLTTPMGTGRLVRDKQEGFVNDAYDRDAWINAIRILAEDHECRIDMARNASERARLFHWDAVGARRRGQIIERLG